MLLWASYLLLNQVRNHHIPTNMLKVDVPHPQPGEEGNVSVGFISPLEPGKKSSHSHKYVESRCSSPAARRRRKCECGLHISS